MKVGILITSRSELEGGGYTITNDILDSLLNNLKLFPYELFFIVINDKFKKITKKLDQHNIKYISLRENLFVLKIVNYFLCRFKFLRYLYNFIGFNKINNFFSQNKVDIIWILSSEYRIPYNIPYICTVWDLQHRTLQDFREVNSYLVKNYRETVISENIKKAEFVITGTAYGKNLINKFYNIQNKKILIIPHPTPSYAFINKRYLLPKKYSFKNFFFYPANFWEHKNHLNLLKGFKIFNEKKIKYNLVLVGNISDKQNYNSIKEFIRENFPNNNVYVLGFVKRNILLSLYDHCLALTYLSFSGPENLPPLESFARGKPVLYSKFKGAYEQLRNLPTYVNPKDPKDIALGFSRILGKCNKKKLIKYALSKNTKKYIASVSTGINAYFLKKKTEC
jgi:glycosyltransferase involved in cell wall biosynthesis